MTEEKGSQGAEEEIPAEPVFSPPDAPAAPSDKLVVSRAAAAANAPHPTMVDGVAAVQRQDSPWSSGAQRLPEAAPPQYQEHPPQYQDNPPQYQDAPPPPPGYGEARPGFAPAQQGAYWPGTQPAAPPQGPPLIPGMAPPPPPPRPGGQAGPPGGPGAPNWAPVPPTPPSRRRGPGLGLFAIGALVIALLAGSIGAGVTVLLTDSGEAPSTAAPVSLGGGNEQQQPRDPKSVAGIAQKVLPSVVTIKVSLGNGQGGSGTGFIVNGGYIITNNHVVEAGGGGTPRINVVFSDEKEVSATVVGTSPENDVAVLKTQGAHDLPALELGDSDVLAPGDPVIAIGSPLGLTGSVTTGIISAKDRVVPTGDEGGNDGGMITALQTDAAINPGNSGGPLVNATNGKVIGMNTAIASLGQGSETGSIGLGFAIPINKVRQVADALIAGKTVKKTMIGISMNTQYQGDGVQILDSPQGIVKDGPADKAGLKPGDLILKVGDRAVTSTDALVAIISSHAPGDTVKVTYRRGGQETTIDVTLGQG
ncbi:trypsin-like peptidase domain-containing protein [Actinocorallia sp. API 0066]|uniref:S1C family serine protease n=1 Tax=Actinocorallia sp. API 0066 TaxID=2896846 RepID=UPI001E2E8FD9|nr:trypsin-like peptidase domain-containing protein [Actinocorallia sp. API 0066]MCD0448046.1 trypsin-like peptidase domain-containing protein [Actinocorallia sp. API 0066]